jgi:hypothetical protein
VSPLSRRRVEQAPRRRLLNSARLGAVLRFYQAEWLSKLPRSLRWRNYVRGARTPVLNPGTCEQALPLSLEDLEDFDAVCAPPAP